MKRFARLSSREIYRNPWLAFEVHDVVHPTGAAGEHGLVVTPPCAAAIVADGGDLLFARQARFAMDGEAVEIVKGGREGAESALDCAQREVREELGVVARVWLPLGALYEIPSIVTGPVDLFFAHGIEHVEPDPEAVESVELVRVDAVAAIRAAAEGRLSDAVTVAALLRYGIASGLLRFAEQSTTDEETV